MSSESELQVYNSFDTMGLSSNLLRGIYSYGFENPSQIQKVAIMGVASGRDLIAQAQSGTGKTGSFAIGSLQRVDESLNETQVIMLAPTRELAKQIYKFVSDISCNMSITIRETIGGHRYTNDKMNAHIIVGTPGRVLDELSKGRISCDKLRCLVLDEADEMLSRGFQEQVKKIFSFIPKESQIVLFSATIPNEVLDITSHFMTNPLKILVKTDELTLEGIRQYYVLVDRDSDKYLVLSDLYSTIAVTQSIIYCNSKKKAQYLSDKMQDNNFVVSCIHGDMDQEVRNKIMTQYRVGNSRVLITTDILSRGIDIQQVSLVINYDVPIDVETYLHRIGRSGRFGRKGVSINLVVSNDFDQLKRIESYYNTHIEELPSNVMQLINGSE